MKINLCTLPACPAECFQQERSNETTVCVDQHPDLTPCAFRTAGFAAKPMVVIDEKLPSEKEKPAPITPSTSTTVRAPRDLEQRLREGFTEVAKRSGIKKNPDRPAKPKQEDPAPKMTRKCDPCRPRISVDCIGCEHAEGAAALKQTPSPAIAHLQKQAPKRTLPKQPLKGKRVTSHKSALQRAKEEGLA
jgi:hypothetical protein